MNKDEIAKLYAHRDMKKHLKEVAIKEANKFYSHFRKLGINGSVSYLMRVSTNDDANLLLDNLISLFLRGEEYEKCHLCQKIKDELNKK